MGLISKKIQIKTPIRYKPESKRDLRNIIVDLLRKGQTNLNCIDVSGIDDMSALFYSVNQHIIVRDIDISEWNVSNVKDMHSAFLDCIEFNSDLSNWNVSNVEVMGCMFANCKKFSSDLSNWKSKAIDTNHIECMFSSCRKMSSDKLIPKWY